MTTRVDHTLRLSLIERFLMSQDGVMDASTWLDGEELRAQVTIIPQKFEVNLCESALIGACKKQLGAENAPNQILVLTARPRAVIRVA